MKRAKSYFLVLIMGLSGGWGANSVAAEVDYNKLFPGNDKRHLSEAGKYRFEFDNDLFVGSDNGFSNGWSFQIHTPVADSWDKLQGPAGWVKSFGGWLPSLSGDGLKNRLSFSIGQIMQTPDELEATAPIPNDVPYVGLIAVQLGMIAYNDVDFRGFGFALGTSGRPSMAEQFQNLVHNLSDSVIAEGWDNQIKSEPLVNMTYMRKKKFYQTGDRGGFSFDASISGDVELGNMVTAAGVRLETRYGKNMPGGFSYYADPIGRTMTYDASLAPVNTKAASIYGTFGIHSSAVAHVITLDGNVIRDNHPWVEDIEKEDVVTSLIVGFHYETPTWAFHFQHSMSSDAADDGSVSATPDADNTFSTILYEWRI